MRFYAWSALFVISSVPAIARADDKKTGEWTDLFNGKDLTGWVVDGPKEYKDKADGNKVKPLWLVDDKMIRTAGAAFGFLRYGRQFSDFLLYVEYRMTKDA